MIDKNSNIVLNQGFYDAAMAMSEGQVSDWIHVDMYGDFKIYCMASTPETLESNQDIKDPYLNLVKNYDLTLQGPAMWKKAQEYNIDFHGDSALEEIYRNHCEAHDDSASTDNAASSAGTQDAAGEAQ